MNENVAVSSNGRSKMSVDRTSQTIMSVLGFGQGTGTKVQGLSDRNKSDNT